MATINEINNTNNHKEIDDEYFKSYNDLELHRHMINDKPRTQSYYDAIMKNAHFFKDKIVMDVGSGTGILSLFAAKAGAKMVHSVEASPIAKLIPSIVKANNFQDNIKVHHCRVESLTLKDLRLNDDKCDDKYDDEHYKVDIIISEWMGVYLLHESMLLSVLFARDNFLKHCEDSMIFPRIAKIYAAPCNLSNHYDEYINFWNNLYGFSFEALSKYAKEMRLKRSGIGYIDHNQLLTQKQMILKLDLKTMKMSDIELIEKEMFFIMDDDNGLLDGVAIWFDTIFTNKNEKKSLVIWNTETDQKDDDNKDEEMMNRNAEFNKVILSTSPHNQETHWKQTLIFLPQRINVKKDDVLGFKIIMKPSIDNYRQYCIELNLLPKDHMKCQLMRAMMQQQ